MPTHTDDMITYINMQLIHPEIRIGTLTYGANIISAMASYIAAHSYVCIFMSVWLTLVLGTTLVGWELVTGRQRSALIRR